MAEHVQSHGGTDAGPEPRFDFSSNANPLGPCPSILNAIRQADLSRYPDPSYTKLRRALADFHDTVPEKIVVGAGASELILRLVRHARGSVHLLGPTFSEYARCASIAGRLAYEAGTTEEFLQLRRTRHGLGFVCWPNNPTGLSWPLEFIDEAAQCGPLVIDLAYAPLCAGGELARVEAAASRAIRLYAPNKAFGLTGVRAAYLVTPTVRRSLSRQAPTWVLDRTGEAFLAAGLEGEALQWLAESRPLFTAWRQSLVAHFQERGIPVHESPATFLLAKVGGATQLTRDLRSYGVRVRDCASFGLREWIRLSAQPPEAQQAFFQHYDELRSATANLAS